MIRYLRDLADTSVKKTEELTVFSSNIQVNGNAQSTSTSTGSIITEGGLAVKKNLYVGGDLTVLGTTTTVSTTNLGVQDNIVELHLSDDSTLLTVDDGKDIGIRVNYFKSGNKAAYFGWSNSTGYFEYYNEASELVTGNISGNLGTARFGSMKLADTTVSTSTTSGALTVNGGVGVAGSVYANGYFYANGISIGTSLSFLGGNITNSTTILSSTSSTSSSTGALVVNGGVGIGSDLNLGGKLAVSGQATVGTSLIVSGTTTSTVLVDKYRTVSSVSNFLTLDLSTASTFKVNVTENITQITITNVPSAANAAIQFALMLTSDGNARSVVWPLSFKWPSGVAPTLTNIVGKTDILVFISIDAGVTWRGFIAGSNYD